ncbi:MAG: sensor histidine kinase [Paludibacter sp.]
MKLLNVTVLSRHFRLIFIGLSLVIIVVSMVFTNRLAKSLAQEEQRKIELWAEATQRFVLADENTDIDFILSVIEGNTTIPVVVVDDKGNLLQSRNVSEPLRDKELFYKKLITRLKSEREAIVVDFGDMKQYIYYDDSRLLTQLYYYPYVQIGVVVVFLLISFFAFLSSKNAEQNKVWVGLSKETAHQLGTPISSLLAWVALLKSRYQDDKLLPDMEKDVNRLRVIAERFSKIGSAPDLQVVSLNAALDNAVQYMSKRASQQVVIQTHYNIKDEVFIRLNIPLFEWVVENLCKNAIDAMTGKGSIDIYVTKLVDQLIIDFKDSGKGIERNNFKNVFKPGYTTKQRGWGLGLSLVKRIIENYHNGKIYVKHSELGKGTTFRIKLKIN